MPLCSFDDDTTLHDFRQPATSFDFILSPDGLLASVFFPVLVGYIGDCRFQSWIKSLACRFVTLASSVCVETHEPVSCEHTPQTRRSGNDRWAIDRNVQTSVVVDVLFWSWRVNGVWWFVGRLDVASKLFAE